MPRVALLLGVTALLMTTACGAQPSVPGDRWQVATPDSQGLDAAKLQTATAYLADHLRPHGGIDTLLIVRHGRVVWSGPAADRQLNIWSATKSLVSTCLGLLIGDRKCTLDSLAKDFAPELAEHYPTVTLRHFATLASGYDGAGGTYGAGDPNDGSLTPCVPAPPLFAPGAKFSYHDDAMREFAYVLSRVAGEPLEELFRRRVAQPIGMSHWRWPVVQGPPGWKVNDGAYSFETSSEDLARLGLLWLNRGRWGDRQLLPAAYVNEATAVQVPVTTPLDESTPRKRFLDGRGVYGLNWWVNGGHRAAASGQDTGVRAWPNAPGGLYAAAGANECKCFVVPEWDMLLVRLGSQGQPADIREVWSEFFRLLGLAVAPASTQGG